MIDFERLRSHMVEAHIAGRGIRDARVLAALRAVPREAFVPEEILDLAYEDSPLPIGEAQTISQPYIVALTTEALLLGGGERVLEIGTGSGYAAAVLGKVAKEVFSIERHESLATSAHDLLARLGYENVHVVHGDGSLGLAEKAPYDAIAVAAAAPKVPKALLEQLAIGGRLVIPVGHDETSQQLVRVTRVGEGEYREEAVAAVAFVPLIGEQGWAEEPRLVAPPAKVSRARTVAALVREVAEPIADIDSASIDALLERVGDARLVLLGEASHGTSEFYRMRARISRELIVRHGFDFVAVEADWPDAARIDDYVLGGKPRSTLTFTPFSRFPTWMWRNEEVETFTSWLRAHNEVVREPARRVGFHGLDLYSLFTSIEAVLASRGSATER
jgi:protein-L-isoaspartate(D-aspartate) O-methyltransferase